VLSRTFDPVRPRNREVSARRYIIEPFVNRSMLQYVPYSIHQESIALSAIPFFDRTIGIRPAGSGPRPHSYGSFSSPAMTLRRIYGGGGELSVVGLRTFIPRAHRSGGRPPGSCPEDVPELTRAMVKPARLCSEGCTSRPPFLIRCPFKPHRSGFWFFLKNRICEGLSPINRENKGHSSSRPNHQRSSGHYT